MSRGPATIDPGSIAVGDSGDDGGLQPALPLTEAPVGLQCDHQRSARQYAAGTSSGLLDAACSPCEANEVMQQGKSHRIGGSWTAPTIFKPRVDSYGGNSSCTSGQHANRSTECTENGYVCRRHHHGSQQAVNFRSSSFAAAANAKFFLLSGSQPAPPQP